VIASLFGRCYSYRPATAVAENLLPALNGRGHAGFSTAARCKVQR